MKAVMDDEKQRSSFATTLFCYQYTAILETSKKLSNSSSISHSLRDEPAAALVDEPQLHGPTLHQQIGVVVALSVHELQRHRREICSLAGKCWPYEHPGVARVPAR